MTINQPAIKLYCNQVNEAYLKEICAGMEEEGVPFEIKEMIEWELEELCYQASTESVLGVGIGVKDATIAIQMSPLPKGKYLFQIDKPTNQQCRYLGMNAARAVKRMPFKAL